MPKLYSYRVAFDYGFAPNPFYGVCTLATCKPEIRRLAVVGDWVIGTGAQGHGYRLGDRLVFFAQVDEVLSFEEYWFDRRFLTKRPRRDGSKKQAYGDNIYSRDPATGLWCQADSHHSLEDGMLNQANVVRDTRTPRVLLGRKFAYWGGDGPLIPTHLKDFGGLDLRPAGRGHRSNFPDSMLKATLEWIHSLDAQGVLGEPMAWKLETHRALERRGST